MAWPLVLFGLGAIYVAAVGIICAFGKGRGR